ncbi:MAG: extracellular solute-binding protein [Proteobacteria bacterium]|nr:extracellular solute-binding protein [Pseudomonadota bacterium]
MRIVPTGHWRVRAVLLVAFALLAACERCAADKNRVVAYTSVDQVFSEPIFRYCEQSTELSVSGVFDTEETKSTGVLNRLIAEAKHPQADIFWSGDPVRPFVLLERGLVEPYRSPAATQLPAALRAEDGSWTGFAARARVLLVNKELVPGSDTPRSIRDLVNPKWKGKTAIANPLFGTTTMHVAALFSTWGHERAKAFLEQLRGNDVRIASSNGEVKRLVAHGEIAFGLTDTDDANEALDTGAPVRVVYPDQQGGGTLVMPTVVVLMKGAPHPKLARRLIDCLLSADVEARMAASAAHMPLRPGVEVPQHVRAVQSLKPMQVDYAEVARTMERIQPWLREWVGL